MLYFTMVKMLKWFSISILYYSPITLYLHYSRF